MKKLLLNLTFTTLLLSVGYSQCNESNWESYSPNLQGCDLAGAYLYGADFWGVDLSGADLTGANLTGANLTYANLCNLTGSAYWECEEPSGITDDNEDGYDDVSFDVGYDAGAASVTPEDGIGQSDVDAAYTSGYGEGFYNGTQSGDINQDGMTNVVDIILYVNVVLGN